MYKKTRKPLIYDMELANECFSEFRKNTKADLYDTSRNKNVVRLRALFYKIMTEYLDMNNRMISDFLSTKGIKKGGCTIYHAKANIEHYYKDSIYFRNTYDKYFTDRADSRKEIITVAPPEPKDELDKIIQDLPFDKRGEIYEMVNLRVKSWSWKNNDRCQVITGAGGLF